MGTSKIVLLATGLATCIALATPPGSHAQLYITELLAINDAVLADEDGDFSDWLEIHNAAAAPVDLGGWYLTDDGTSLARWQFPATLLPAGGYLVVFASDKDRAVAGAQLHTSFRLAGGGEYLALVHPDGSTVEHGYAPAFPAQSADTSYGLAPDLATPTCFTSPTPGAANDAGSGCEVSESPDFDPGRGFYQTPFDVTLSSASAGAPIYYTTNGAEPSPSTGTLYTTPIPIGTTSIVRAAAFATGLQPSASITHTYIFPADVLTQTGAGFPVTWAADYEMDPDVVTDPRYSATLPGDLLAIPTLSIVMDVGDLFGEADGIYNHPGQRGIEWERPASAELIHPDGTEGFQANCGTRIQGELSRALNRKKSFRLAFKTIYGPSRLEYPLFGPSSVRSFDKIRLRASSEKSWSAGSKKGTYIRDQWVRETQLAMGRIASRGIFVHLYLNGLYWGLYNPVEKPDEEFVSDHFGGESDQWDVHKHPFDVVNGDREAWDIARGIAAGGLASDTAYASIQQYIDVPNLIDYFITNLHAGTTDWDGNNWYAARRRAPGEGFKFFSWDAEQSMVSLKTKRVGIGNENRPSTFYSALQANAEFRVLFGDHVHRHFFNDGALTPARSRRRFTDSVALLDRAIVAESARWGDTKTGSARTRDDDWLVQVEWLRLAYFPRRTGIVLEQFRSIGLYPTVEAPSFNRHGGFINPGFSLEITAPAGTIHYALDGSDPRLPGGAAAPGASAYAGPIAISSDTVVRSRARNGTSWSALTEASFTIDISLRITELMYHPADPASGPFSDDDFEFLEIMNTGPTSVSLPGLSFTDGIDFTFGAGSLAPGERAVLVANLVAFESRYGAGLPVVGEYGGKLDNAGEPLRLESATGGTIQEFVYDDSWHPGSDGDGFSLLAGDPAAGREAWSTAAGWRAGVVTDGTPGSADPAACSDGADNDGDGLTDHPADPGCSDAAEDREDPQCDDGIDNDSDGDADLADVQCATAAGTLEAGPPIDTFICYQARESRLGERFEPLDVLLDDELDGPGTYTVRAPRALCLAASVDGGVVVDAVTHLESFSVRPTGTTPDHIRRTALEVKSLGPLFVDTSKPDRLLVPASMDTQSPVTAPLPFAHDVDHYKCYKARITKRSPKYWPKDVQLGIDDELESRAYDIRRPNALCTPVDKNGEGIKDPTRHMMCYQARRAKGEAKHTFAIGVHTATQFGQGQRDTRKVESVCVPARLP